MNSDGPRWTQAGTKHWPANDQRDTEPKPPMPDRVKLLIALLAALLLVAGGCKGEPKGEAPVQVPEAPERPAEAVSVDWSTYHHVHTKELGQRAMLMCLEALPASYRLGQALHICEVGDR